MPNTEARSFLLVLGVFLTTPTARAERIAFGLRPEVGAQAGAERFEFSATIPNASPTVAVSAQSKLTYPVATTLVGGMASIGTGAVSLVGSVLTNMNNPWGTMLDQDFVTGTSGTSSETLEISHTESRATLRELVLEAGLRLRVAELSPEPGNATLRAVGGFRFESNTFDVFGLSGWQLDSSSNQVPVSLPDDLKGLHYETKYYIPFVGARIDAALANRFSLGTEARVLAAWSTHDDDHVLRHKIAHASPHGIGFALGAEPMLDLGGSSAVHAFLGIDAQIEYLVALDGTLEQHYYADDPSLTGDQTAQAIPNGTFSYTSWRARLLAFVEVRF